MAAHGRERNTRIVQREHRWTKMLRWIIGERKKKISRSSWQEVEIETTSDENWNSLLLEIGKFLDDSRLLKTGELSMKKSRIDNTLARSRRSGNRFSRIVSSWFLAGPLPTRSDNDRNWTLTSKLASAHLTKYLCRFIQKEKLKLNPLTDELYTLKTAIRYDTEFVQTRRVRVTTYNNTLVLHSCEVTHTLHGTRIRVITL